MSEIGLIHADIKPENILYNRERKLYKLADFGLSIKRGQNITGIRGTPQYISPEIYAYSQFSSASDIWAFGETLLNMFLYKIVFEPENGGGGIILDIRNGLAARWQRWLGPVPSQLAEDLRHKTRFTVTSISNSWKGELRQQLQADDAPELAVFADFIERCLRYNPEERITAREAISHPFVSHRKIRQRKPANVVKSSAI
jgi:serine/threonine protein kinase